MRSVCCCVVVVVIALMMSSGAMAQDDQRVETLKTDAQLFVQQMVAHEFEDAVASFDSTMASVMPPDKLGMVWGSVTAQYGEYESVKGVRVEAVGTYQIVYVTIQFKSAPLDCKVVFDLDDKIAGLYFAEPTNAVSWQPPDYADTAAVDEVELTFGKMDWKLPGTLYLPKSTSSAKCQVVVLVHGSGPNDRDETIGPNKPFRDMALGLATKGIAVFAYDKRTNHYAKKMADLKDITIDDEVTDDALSAITLMTKQDRIDSSQVFLLGHSLGGMMAPRIAELSGKLAGIIIMAGTPRPLEDVILDQYQYIDSIQEANGAGGQIDLQKLENQIVLAKSDQLDSTTPAEDLPLGAPASYWLSLRGYEPDRVASQLTIPILILQGMRDYQVTNKDLLGWRYQLGKQPNVTIDTYDNLNHLFMAGVGKATPAEYNEPGHVDVKVIDDIAAWIKAN